MLSDYEQQMWWKTGDGVSQAVVSAQKKAVFNADDFKFALNISLDVSNIERNAVNAGNIREYYGKEIAPCFAGLSERERQICTLDWIVVLYRALHEIAGIRKAPKDDKTLEFVHALQLWKSWQEAREAYQSCTKPGSSEKAAPAEIKNASGLEEEAKDCAAGLGDHFDAWLDEIEASLILPTHKAWVHALHAGQVRRSVKRGIRIAAAAAVVLGIISYLAGIGPAAVLLHHERPRLVPEGVFVSAGTYPPVEIRDYNASTTLESETDAYSDRHLMDGDPKTPWAEGEEDAGIGRKLYFNLADEGPVHYIVVWNGNQSDGTVFKQFNRVKDISLMINSKRSAWHLKLLDTDRPQYIRVENRDVDKFWIQIDSVYQGAGPDNATAVSEVQIY